MKYLLAIDIGNTNTVLGIMEGDRVLTSWRVTTGNLQTDDELGILIIHLLSNRGIPVSDIKTIGICSVVPDVTAVYESVCRKYLGHSPFTISNELDLGIAIRYDDPKQVGADRLANVIAAFHRFGGPGIVVDFGTATTFDVYAENGDYLGGVIAPGLETAAMTLHRRAAKLPRINLELPEKLVATNTTASMQNGILLGTLYAMEGIINRIQSEFSAPLKLTLTGGFGPFIQQHSSLTFELVPDLVLEGVFRIGRRLNLC